MRARVARHRVGDCVQADGALPVIQRVLLVIDAAAAGTEQVVVVGA